MNSVANVAPALLDVSDLSVEYSIRGQSGFRRKKFAAISDVAFSLQEGKCLAIVGESGSGKSTTARAITGLISRATGKAVLLGKNIFELSAGELRAMRRNYQMVFQDPYSSLNPSFTVLDLVAEPLLIHENLSRSAIEAKVADALTAVGLSLDHIHRYPYEFSGGQRQRIAIARALVIEPKLVVLDEPVSALDVPTQNQIVALLERRQSELQVAYLLISHDLGLVRHIADDVAVMYLGRIVEIGATETIYNSPSHPYTRVLLGSNPICDPSRQRARRSEWTIKGEMPDPSNPPRGCAFSSRCPNVMPICHETRPNLSRRSSGQLSACHLNN